jgi:hypothetical protein
MKQFLVRRISTQVIEYAVKLDDADPAFMGPVGSDFPAPTVNPEWQDGMELIAYEGITHLGDRPSDTAKLIWNGTAPVWSDPKDFEQLRMEKSAEINASWMEADATSFLYAGEHVGAGPDDIVRLNSINGYIGLMNAMPPDWPGVWKTKANTYIPLPNVESWKPFYTAFVTKGVANYMAAQSLKAQVAAATTVAEIAAIAWPA